MTFVDIDAFNELRVPVITKPNLLVGYNGEVECTTPMTTGQLVIAKQSIIEKPTEETKLIVAKQIILYNCFFVSQLKEIMTLFISDKAKLEVAKASYGRVYDVGNCYQLNDLFEEESSIKIWNDFLNAQ